ncbi:unnamed protein product, partial [Meganyctiphanes norvegica]
MAEDEYYVSAGSLKLKGVDESGIKKKKKKKKSKERQKEAFVSREVIEDEEILSKVFVPRMTDSERNFEENRRKMDEKRILKKAMKTHKQKVEEFNAHLDSLSEHHDVPKCSWTK